MNSGSNYYTDDSRVEEDGPLLPVVQPYDRCDRIDGCCGPARCCRARTYNDIIAASIACLSALSMGFVLGYSSPVSADPMINAILDEDKMSWFSSLVAIGAITGGPVAGVLVERMGRRTTLLLSHCPLAIGWFLIVFAREFIILYLGRILTGIAIGMISLTAPLYIAEMSTKAHRGMLGSGFQLLVTVGILFVYSLGFILNWAWLAVTGIIIAALSTALLLTVPETPRWLIARGARAEAMLALHWLSAVEGEMLEEEYNHISDNLAEQSNEQFTATEFLRPTVFKPLLISLGLMFFSQFSGINSVIFYSAKIFQSAGFSNPLLPSIIVAAILVVSTVVACLMMDLVGRRPLLITSGVVMTISISLLATYYILPGQEHQYTWLSLLSVCLFVSFFSLGWGPIPWLAMSELFPSRARGLCSGIATSVNWTCVFIVTKEFSAVAAAAGTAATFYGFAVFNLVGVIFVAATLPETKGRSLEDIERLFGGGVQD